MRHLANVKPGSETEFLPGSKIAAWMRRLVHHSIPEGYQDENGFHFGRQTLENNFNQESSGGMPLRESVSIPSQNEAQTIRVLDAQGRCPGLVP